MRFDGRLGISFTSPPWLAVKQFESQPIMRSLKEIVIAAAALILFLVISSALFGSERSISPKKSVAMRGSWIGAEGFLADRLLAKRSLSAGGPVTTNDATTTDRWMTRSITPISRINQVFSQFVRNESKKTISAEN